MEFTESVVIQYLIALIFATADLPLKADAVNVVI